MFCVTISVAEVKIIMKSEILLALKKADDFVSGEKLSSMLGVTRSAVWKYVNALKEDGCDIISVRNKGYKLVSAPDMLNEYEILNGNIYDVAGKKLIVMDSVDSTNEEIKRLASKGEPAGTVVAAEKQTAGKGRFGRSWDSDDGGLFFSLLLRPELPPGDISSITLAAGFAVCLAVREYTKTDARIKWPNDVIIDKKKICGILTEMTAQSDRIDHVSIGIGINVNNPHFPDEISGKATSLFIETGKKINRNEFFGVVIKYLDDILKKFFISLSVDDMNMFKELCVTIGREVTIKRINGDIQGKAVDITAGGELVVYDGNKNIVVNSGEVTVQGIY